ncbi:hypothetical protein EV426DRAFT_630077 [Tirmania nivea]|nr:hypothetical protein EV426DRAFT_630077 [Tirmania nivea]
MSEQHHYKLEESQEQSQPKRKRITYTSELKLKLMQLCIENGDRYIETVPEDNFWSYIRTLFFSITELNTGNGSTIRRKVADIVSERKAIIAVQRAQSGVAVAPPTDLEQATDTWIEWMERRGEEKQAKSTQSTQIKQEKEKAAIKRQNLTKTLSEKQTFQEVATVDLTDSDTIRDKRRKTGKAWASGKDKEMQENWDRLDHRDAETLALMRDILNAISTSSANASSANASSANASSTNSESSSANSASTTPATSSANASSTNSFSTNASSTNSSSTNSSSTNSESSSANSSTEGRLAKLEAGMSEILRILSEMRK